MSTNPKMKRAKIVKLSLDELAGVDAGAQAAAGSVIMKRKDDRAPATSTMKCAALTSAVLGHSHMLSGIDDMQSGCSSSERVDRPDMGQSDYYSNFHSHNWIRQADGSIVVGESAGHTHVIDMTSASLAPTDALKSSPAIAPVSVASMTTKIVVLTEAQDNYRKQLSDADGELFIAKSAVDRDVDVAKALAADPVVHTTSDGIEIRKSAGPVAVAMAKRADEQGKQLAAQAVEITKANDARELVELAKRAGDVLGNLAGKSDVHVALLKAAESIVDATVRAAAIETLKSANAALAKSATAKGIGGHGDAVDGDPLEAFNGEVAKFAVAKGITDLGVAQDRFLSTDEGRVAKRAYDATRAYGK